MTRLLMMLSICCAWTVPVAAEEPPCGPDNLPPDPSCRAFFEHTVDEACDWHLDSADLAPDFVDPEGHALVCESSPTEGMGLQMRPLNVWCADACGADSGARCLPLVVPRDRTPPQVSVNSSPYVVQVADGWQDGWTHVRDACGLVWDDNCTSNHHIVHGISDVISDDPNEQIGGRLGHRTSPGIATDWHRFVLNLDAADPALTVPRTYTIAYDLIDDEGNRSHAQCSIQITAEPEPEPEPCIEVYTDDCVNPSTEHEGGYGPPYRVLGLVLHPDALDPDNPNYNPCPAPPADLADNWRHSRLFELESPSLERPDAWESPDDPSMNGIYCLYEWNEVDPLSAGDEDAVALVNAFMTMVNNNTLTLPGSATVLVDYPLQVDSRVVLPMQSAVTLREEVNDLLYVHSLEQLGAVAPLPDHGMGALANKVYVAVVDSALPASVSDGLPGCDRLPADPQGVPGCGQLTHGRDMGLLIRKLACPDNDPDSSACAVQISTHLALELEPDSVGGSQPNQKRGGYYGTPTQLAQALWEALVRWKAEAPASQLIINLSVGWEIPTDAAPTSLAEQAVRRVLEKASCLGALIIAASGNETGGDEPWTGPVYPAGWARELAPSCGNDGMARYSPLVHAIGGIDGTQRALANTRDDSRPYLTTYAFQVPVDDIYLAPGSDAPRSITTSPLTGTSISAAAASAIAAVVWFHDSTGLGANALMDTLYDQALELNDQPTPDYCPEGDLACGSIRRLSLCHVLERLDPLWPSPCPSISAENPAWPKELLEMAETVKDDEITLSNLQSHDVTKWCGNAAYPDAQYLLFVPWGEKLPADPCPFDMYYTDAVLPQVNSQPFPTICPACWMDSSRDIVTLTVDEGLRGGGRLESVGLRLSDDVGNVYGFWFGDRLEGDTTLVVKGLDTTGMTYTTAELTARTTGLGERPVGVAEQIPMSARSQ